MSLGSSSPAEWRLEASNLAMQRSGAVQARRKPAIRLSDSGIMAAQRLVKTLRKASQAATMRLSSATISA
jgi:hypothetical protein